MNKLQHAQDIADELKKALEIDSCQALVTSRQYVEAGYVPNKKTVTFILTWNEYTQIVPIARKIIFAKETDNRDAVKAVIANVWIMRLQQEMAQWKATHG